jgi:4-hydroxythreonine-4-phosphate dehydrogenase
MCFYIDALPEDKRWAEDLLPSVGITIGDPGGIGPEVALKAAFDPRVRACARPVIVGDSGIVRRVAADLGMRMEIGPAENRCRASSQVLLGSCRRDRRSPREALTIVHTPVGGRRFPVGKPSRVGGLAAGRAIEEAAALAGSRVLDGVVTAPVSKQSLSLAGYGMIGHTELLAELTGARHCAMMMKSDRLRVVLATTHVPLAKVAAGLRSKDLVEKIKLTYEYLVWYAWLKRPRIAVCGLNPHAGEGGMLGREERQIIAPAVHRARRLGLNVEGPLSADTVFRPGHEGRYDAIVAMYHDQGIIPVKMSDPGKVVNVTLGLPFARTSPGHGTAFDIAGKKVASAESMVTAAIECAEMAKTSPAAGRKVGHGGSPGRAAQIGEGITLPTLQAFERLARASRKNVAGFLKDTGSSSDDR